MSESKLTYSDNKFFINSPFFINRNFYHCTKKHTHDFVEIVYIKKGKSTHTINEREYPVSSGNVLFINYGSVHSFNSASGFEYFDILIKPEFISESLLGVENAFSLLTVKDFSEFADTVNRDNCLIKFSGEERKTFEALISLMYTESREEKQGTRMILSSLLNTILTMIFRKMSITLNENFRMDEKLLKYIKDNCHLNIKLEDIAKKCSYNPSYFSRIFKSYTGITFSEHLTKCRIDRATELLLTCDMSVETVIDKVGYSNRTKFFEDFRISTGSSPLQYRKSKK